MEPLRQLTSLPGMLAAALALGGLVFACSGLRSEAAYAAQIPSDVRPAYDRFVQKCSKCHALSRALDSGIDDDAYWVTYVRRMRLQPGSGISAEDEATVLQFLRYYARDLRERKAQRSAPGPAPDASASTPVPAPLVEADGGTYP